MWIQVLHEQKDTIENRLSATNEEIANLNHDVMTLSSVVNRARKSGMWNVRMHTLYYQVVFLFSCLQSVMGDVIFN